MSKLGNDEYSWVIVPSDRVLSLSAKMPLSKKLSFKTKFKPKSKYYITYGFENIDHRRERMYLRTVTESDAIPLLDNSEYVEAKINYIF